MLLFMFSKIHRHSEGDAHPAGQIVHNFRPVKRFQSSLTQYARGGGDDCNQKFLGQFPPPPPVMVNQIAVPALVTNCKC